jgi:NitT/TauT family transport system substrate-binding protein
MQVIGVTDISDGGDGIIAAAGVDSIAQLKGKRVAFPEGQPSHLMLLYHLDKAGLQSADIVPILTDDAGKAGELFAAGQVDAAVTWEPWLSTAVEAGKGKVLVDSKGSKDILIGILAANQTRVDGSSDKLTRFLRGWYRSLDYALAHPDEANPIMAKAFNLPPEEFGEILSGLRFIGKDEAMHLLGVGGPAEFLPIAKHNEALWRKNNVLTGAPLDAAATFTSGPLAGVK